MISVRDKRKFYLSSRKLFLRYLFKNISGENQKESYGVSINVGYGNDDIAPTRYRAANPYLLYKDIMSSELHFLQKLN